MKKQEKTDILLISTPSGSSGFKKSPWRFVLSSSVSNGILSLASFLHSKDINVKVLDAAALFLINIEIVTKIKEINPRVVAFSATTSAVNNAAYIAAKIKKAIPNIITIIGGHHISSRFYETMNIFDCFDIGVLGEGEFTLLELMNNIISDDFKLAEIKGIIYRKDGKIIKNESRDFIQDLSNTVPLPKWDLLEGFPGKYKPPIFFSKSPHAATLVTSRGCPFTCKFCDKSVSGDVFRSFSAEYIIECIKELVSKYNIEYIMFYDDNFTVDKDRLYQLCNLILKNKLKIKWSCDAHINTLDEDLLHVMKKAGCWSIAFGLESGSSKILKSLNKEHDIDKAVTVVNMTYDVGIKTKGLFMLGSPEETLETINETKVFIKRLKLSTMNLSKFTPYPGTVYYKMMNLDNESELWPKLTGIIFVDINSNLSRDLLEKEYKEVLTVFYNNKNVFASHLFYIFGTINHTFRLLKSFFYALMNLISKKKEIYDE